jgi:NAD(P)H dehydrogenase (quinone)
MNPNIAVIHYSSTGNTLRLATALAEGARESGAAVRLLRVPELAPRQAIEKNPAWLRHLQQEESEGGTPLATLDDLVWADGLAFGSPTRFGGPAAQLKNFLDSTGGLWAKGELAKKFVTAFTSASTAHGGLESTILALLNVAYHWGALIMPLGYADEVIRKQTGNPYGATWVSRGGSAPDDVALSAARIQGRRFATVVGALKRGLAAAQP